VAHGTHARPGAWRRRAGRLGALYLVLRALAVIPGPALPLSLLAGSRVLLAPIVVILAAWTPLAVGLTARAAGHAVRERLQ
jgi:hypothetical protein